MSIEIRRLSPDDFEAFSATVDLGFAAPEPSGGRPGNRETWPPERSFGAYDGADLVGTTTSFAFEMTVPGGRSLPTAGVSAVVVLPTHRRQGVLRSMMEHQITGLSERGEPLAALWASESGIYGRFGYGCAADTSHWSLRHDRTEFRPDVVVDRRLRIVDEADAAAAFAPVYDAVAADTPGFMSRDRHWWAIRFDNPPWEGLGVGPLMCIAHESDSGIDGYVLLRRGHNQGSHLIDGTVTVAELAATNPVAEASLWRFCFDADLMTLTAAGARPSQEDLALFLADPRWLEMISHDGLYVRLLDLPAALEGRGWFGTDTITFEISDALVESNTGRWRVEAAGGQASCVRTDAAADLVCDTADLASAYLGRPRFAALARVGRIGEQTPGAALAADRLFAGDRTPWCPSFF